MGISSQVMQVGNAVYLKIEKKISGGETYAFRGLALLVYTAMTTNISSSNTVFIQ